MAEVTVTKEEQRARVMHDYNMLRKDPLINSELFMREVLTSLGYDPDKFMVKEPVNGLR